MHRADSHCCTAETNNIVMHLYSNLKKEKYVWARKTPGGINTVMQNLNSCNRKREMSQEHWVHPRGRQTEGHRHPPGLPSAVAWTEESCTQSPKLAVLVRELPHQRERSGLTLLLTICRVGAPGTAPCVLTHSVLTANL